MAILNPYKESLSTLPGTRILVESFGLIGSEFIDPTNPARVWVVIGTLRPLHGKPNRGIRARVTDQLGFTSMVEQQDLELLMFRAKPGELCPWTQERYPHIGNIGEGWSGLSMDEDDLADDLHIREFELRESLGYDTLPELQITRRIHSQGRDMERLDILLGDYDPTTGIGPDMRIETIGRRWSKVQQEAVAWTP